MTKLPNRRSGNFGDPEKRYDWEPYTKM